MNRRREGSIGESEAVRFLKSKGYKILQRNYRTKFGEIDLITKKKGCYVFVEVKRRRTLGYEEIFFSIDQIKQEHLVKSALIYLKEKNIKKSNFRFDVVIITPIEKKLIENAFMIPQRYYV